MYSLDFSDLLNPLDNATTQPLNGFLSSEPLHVRAYELHDIAFY